MKMTANIVLGIRLSPNSFQRVSISGVNLESKVEQLKLEASKATNLPKHFLELIYCGNILDDESILQACGVKPGVMVHVLKKKEKDPPPPVRAMTEADVQELVMAFRTFTRHPNYRSALHIQKKSELLTLWLKLTERLSRPEVLENIMMATPGLSDDPVAISILQDPELLVHMENADLSLIHI
ncbi:hypothetical protein C0J52_21787 [Blattella germanica]|nr:hypothetical protein C0J52_21787 [Blattella germanica]